jgi:rare lipoprotein A
VVVTNLANGQEVIVRVNDRGPWSKSRIVDLSYAAAKQIGMHRSGTAKVKLERLD